MLDDVQAFVVAAVPSPDNCVVFPIHADKAPDIIGNAGNGFTVTVIEDVHPVAISCTVIV